MRMQRLEALELPARRRSPARIARALPARALPVCLDPSFLGLTGTLEAIAQTTEDFKVFHQKVAGGTATSYTLDHTAASFVFDAQGRVRLFLLYGLRVDESVADIKRLM